MHAYHLRQRAEQNTPLAAKSPSIGRLHVRSSHQQRLALQQRAEVVAGPREDVEEESPHTHLPALLLSDSRMGAKRLPSPPCSCLKGVLCMYVCMLLSCGDTRWVGAWRLRGRACDQREERDFA